MKKIVFFPYHNDLKVIFPYKDKLTNYEIIGFASYREDGCLIEELNQLYGLKEKDIDELLSECDAIIILDNYRNCRTDKYYSVIEHALSKDKEVLITPSAASELELKEYVGKYKLLCKEPSNIVIVNKMYDEYKTDRLYDVDVPVIAVMGLGRHCGKFECQIFTESVLKEQYRTTVLSTNPLGALFGFYTMPEFLYQPISFEAKVFKFNLYVRLIVQHEKPDVLILGIPEGITYAEKRVFNHFSEHALVITAAVSVDLAVLDMYFLDGEIDDNGLNAVVSYCENRYDVPIGAIFMSDVLYQMPAEDIDPVIYEPLSNEFIKKYHPNFQGLSTNIFSMSNKSAARNAVLQMVKPLQENMQAV